MFPPKLFDRFPPEVGYSEGLDAFRFFFKKSCVAIIQVILSIRHNFSTRQTGSVKSTGDYFEYGVFKDRIGAPVDFCRCCAAVPHTSQQRLLGTVLDISRKPTVAQVGETVVLWCFAGGFVQDYDGVCGYCWQKS